MGGEKVPPLQAGRKRIGSPPRGRGKGIHGVSSASPMKDHPRVGGEKLNRRPWSCSRRGSPPRGRGKVSGWMSWTSASGITPAWAGKREWEGLLGQDPGDHPRVGGEKHRLMPRKRQKKGSPPRGRGKGMGQAAHQCNDGITPAWAGKRVEISKIVSDYGDHPRVGGEKSVNCLTSQPQGGSPPRGRGKVLRSG